MVGLKDLSEQMKAMETINNLNQIDFDSIKKQITLGKEAVAKELELLTTD